MNTSGDVLKNSKQIPISVALAEVQMYLCRSEWVVFMRGAD